MDSGQSSLFQVTVDFKESHLFFPTIVIWVLLILLGAIFLIYGLPKLRAFLKGEKKIQWSTQDFDKLRFFGTIILTTAYFISMDFVGGFFPNMGYGFLLMSVPFIFLLSLLYLHEITRRKLVISLLNSVISPCIAWYVLAQMFNITLP